MSLMTVGWLGLILLMRLLIVLVPVALIGLLVYFAIKRAWRTFAIVLISGVLVLVLLWFVENSFFSLTIIDQFPR